MDAAREALPGRAVGSILVSSDVSRSTQVMFTDDHGLPLIARLQRFQRWPW